MKRLTNLVTFALAFIIPIALLILISSLSDLDLDVFTLMIVSTIGIFANEIIARQRNEDSIWTTISKSTRDKMIFAICYFLFWAIASLSLYLKLGLGWVISAFIVGYLVSLMVFRLFASQSMKENFPKYTRPRFRFK